MPTTSNFGWTTPADTDLVKDGAAAIRTLGNGIDTSLVDLKGGTTGQILSKNSNTDLDYTWINNDQGDITEVQAGTGISVASGTGPVPVVTNTVATTFDAKGDLVVGTGADTFAKLTVGTNGHTLVADSGETTGLKWAAASSGGMTELASGSLSGSSVSLTSISASYKDLVLVIRNYQPASDQRLTMRLNSDANSNRYADNSGTQVAELTFTDTQIYAKIGDGNDSATSQALYEFRIIDYTNTTTWKLVDIYGVGNNPTTNTSLGFGRTFGFYNQTAAISAISVAPASGNFTAGTYILYGVK